MSMQIPKSLQAILTATDDTLGGSLRFKGTRIPLELFLDTISTGYSLDNFLATYPTVHREQAEAVLTWQNQVSKDSVGLPTSQ
jgi:uncharacterized protein (DUF433 family)